MIRDTVVNQITRRETQYWWILSYHHHRSSGYGPQLVSQKYNPRTCTHKYGYRAYLYRVL